MIEQSGEVRVIASSRNWIEGAAIQQLEKTAQLPGMRFAVGLPDLHPGKGSPIGAAYGADGWLYPHLVGNDIGCGVGLWKTELAVRRSKPDALADRMRDLDGAWEGDVEGLLANRNIQPTAYDHSIGTIGGGNHFAELQRIERLVNPGACEQLGIMSEAVYLCVHSGSRGLGEAILREHTGTYGAKGLPAGSSEATDYFERHENARRWAVVNREMIAARVSARLRTAAVGILDCCHNWVEPVTVADLTYWIHRKGAAPSTKGPVVIPGSRGAFTYIVRPVNPTERSGYSLAHGAGRKWSRTDCKARLERRYTAKELGRTELGSHVICEDKELLYEEAPQAYKSIDVVIEDLVQDGLAEVIATLRPLVTYKVRRGETR
jgi:release factor H-coupled RctB family protein